MYTAQYIHFLKSKCTCIVYTVRRAVHIRLHIKRSIGTCTDLYIYIEYGVLKVHVHICSFT